MFTGMLTLQAQDIPPPPRENANDPNRPGKPDGDRPRWSPGSRPGMPGMPPGGGEGVRHIDKDRMEAFKQLTEEERLKMRAAFEKVWNNPDITAARERLTKANDEYREIFHKALLAADPEVASILSKIKPPMSHEGGPMMGNQPDLNDPEFAKKAPQRLASELQFWARAEKRDIAVAPLHEKLLQVPAVREALKKLQEVDKGEREEAWKKLRETYQTAVKMEMGSGRKEGEPRPNNPNR